MLWRIVESLPPLVSALFCPMALGIVISLTVSSAYPFEKQI